MINDNYPESFEIDDSRLSGLVLDAMLEINSYMSGRENHKHKKEVEVLSGLFKGLSTEKYSDPSVEVKLAKYFYWPRESLEGKTTDEFKLYSHLFSMELDNFKDASKEKQEELMGWLKELFDIVLPYGNYRRYQLAA